MFNADLAEIYSMAMKLVSIVDNYVNIQTLKKTENARLLEDGQRY
jgi:hypothetical protein